MNKVYRLVWNRALGVLQVATELARGPRGGMSMASGESPVPARTPLARACLLALAVGLGGMALPVSAATATYVVTSPNDSGDTGVPGSLSWAIAQANAHPGSTISLQLDSGSGITGTGALPRLDYDVTLTSGSDVTLNAAFRGNGAIHWVGEGTLTVTGTQTDVAWDIQNGTLQLGNGDGTGAYIYGANSAEGDGGTGVNVGDGAVLAVDYNSQIAGGYGAEGGYAGGAGVHAGAATIDNAGLIAGSTGSPGLDAELGEGEPVGLSGEIGGTGGAGVEGAGFTLGNTGTIHGGTGGYGGSGGYIIGNYGGDGGTGGAGVTGSAFSVANGGYIEGGAGGYGGVSGYGGTGGTGGAGISGRAFSVGNTGSITGGLGGTADSRSWLVGVGGTGGDGVTGAQFELDNQGDIHGGQGGSGTAGSYAGSGDGGIGGMGVSGSAFNASNRGTILGGAGGTGGSGGLGGGERPEPILPFGLTPPGAGGAGGAGVGGTGFTFDNQGGIAGGNGGDGGIGGLGYGGYAPDDAPLPVANPVGGVGGAGVSGAGFDFANAGDITGGNGGRGGVLFNVYGGYSEGEVIEPTFPAPAVGGAAGAGVSGAGFSLTNTGTVSGGVGGLGGYAAVLPPVLLMAGVEGASAGYYGVIAYGGTGGAGGAGVSGDKFQLDNQGRIAGGQGSDGTAGINAASGNGGMGGAGVYGTGFSATNHDAIAGGNGGAGGAGGRGGPALVSDIGPAPAGAGGAGGVGVGGSGFSFANQGKITGGNGGNGGIGGAGYYGYAPEGMPAPVANPFGGDGGAGVSGTGFTFANAGSITGGNGGSGGSVLAYGDGETDAPVAPAGGAGAAGVSGAGFTLTNTGSITGGNGGMGGYASVAPVILLDASTDAAGDYGQAGVGGAGVMATGGATVINAGTIAGGLADEGDGVRANAVDFAGGGNMLVVQAGSTLLGNAVSHSGAGAEGDTLALGGDLDGSFALGQIGALDSGAQYQGFTRFLKSGASTWTLTGATAGDQHWTVAAGELAVDGTLAGQLVVGKDGRLSGNGTLGNLDLAGTLAPGHSIGALTTTGDVVIRNTAVYEVETDEAGHSDLLVVGGKLVLQGGSVLSLARDGHYSLDTAYTIIKADDGIQGQFGAFESSLAFLTPTVDYLGNSIVLTLVRNDVDFCAIAATANQCAVGGALSALGSGAVHDALVTQDADTARAAMAEWSGESFASTRTVLLDNSRFVRQAMGDRLHRADGRLNNARAIGESAGSVWATGWEHAGHLPGDGNASTVQSSGHGLLLGMDAPLGDQWRAGVTAGLGQDVVRVDALGSEASVHSKHLGAFAGAAWGNWTAEGGAAASWHDIASTRQLVTVLPATLHADYHGRTDQAWVEGGYRLGFTHGQVQPFVNVAHVAVHTDQAQEQGGAAMLNSGRETTEATFATAGVHGQWQLSGDAALMYGTLAWRHVDGDRAAVAQQRFTDSGRFAVSGAPLSANAAVVQAGFDFGLSRNTRLRAGYDGVLAGSRDSAVSVTFQMTF